MFKWDSVFQEAVTEDEKRSKALFLANVIMDAGAFLTVPRYDDMLDALEQAGKIIGDEKIIAIIDRINAELMPDIDDVLNAAVLVHGALMQYVDGVAIAS